MPDQTGQRFPEEDVARMREELRELRTLLSITEENERRAEDAAADAINSLEHYAVELRQLGSRIAQHGLADEADTARNLASLMGSRAQRARSERREVYGRLRALLYLLMRDHLPTGSLAQAIGTATTLTGEVRFSSQHLADYAGDLATRLIVGRESTHGEVDA